MSKATDKLQAAQQKAMANRPKVGGFPYLAETLRQADVLSNTWTLPSCQSIYVLKDGPVVFQGTPLVSGMVDIPSFDESALIAAIRADQTGKSTFPEFLEATWKSGVIWYRADFLKHTVTYGGVNGESYVESYPAAKT